MSVRNDRKIANPGDKCRFCDCGLFAQSAAMFIHSALCQLSLQTWCQQGAVSEFSIWVMYLFTFSIENNVVPDRLNSYFSLIQHYFCIFICNCKRSDHY